MPLYLLLLALFLSFTNYSCAQYCLCKPGSQAPDPYQKVINYACGNGANCGPVQPNGPCYVANDIATICSYAANSYYQNQKTLGATCDFGGVAAPSSTLPADLPSGCTFPTSAGPAGPGSNGTGTPTSPTGGFTPGPGTTSPGISSPTGLSPPGLGPPGLGPPGFGPTGFGPPGFGPSGFGGTPGFAPTGSFSDPNDAMSLLESPNHIVSLSLTLFAGILILWG